MKMCSYTRTGLTFLAAATLWASTTLADDSRRSDRDRSSSSRTGSSQTQSNSKSSQDRTGASDTAQSDKLSAADQSFMREAAKANVMEVNSARLALDKSQNDNVRRLAQRILDDHTKANSQLVNL